MGRPPHSRTAPEPKYQQINEQPSYDFEWSVFFGDWNGILDLTKNTNSPCLKESYDYLARKLQRFYALMDQQKETFDIEESLVVHVQKIRSKIEAKLQESEDQGSFVKRKFFEHLLHRMDQGREKLKNERKEYDRAEKELLDALMSHYKMVSVDTIDPSIDSHTKESAELKYHRAQTIQLAFQTLLCIRSFMHDPTVGINRDSGEVKVQHVYEVSVHQMNRYLQKIAMANNHEEKLTLYHEMKLAIIVALLHDFIEDHPHVPLQALKEVLVARTRPDTRITIREAVHREQSGHSPAYDSFIEDNWEEIVHRMQALTKPKEKKQRPGYIRRQVLENEKLSPNAKVEVLMTKLMDRMNNLKTLRYMTDLYDEAGTLLKSGAARQMNKIHETIELLENTWILSEAFTKSGARHREDLWPLAVELAGVCDDELDRLSDNYTLSDAASSDFKLQKHIFKYFQTKLKAA